MRSLIAPAGRSQSEVEQDAEHGRGAAVFFSDCLGMVFMLKTWKNKVFDRLHRNHRIDVSHLLPCIYGALKVQVQHF
jgi:hypothetical protein